MSEPRVGVFLDRDGTINVDVDFLRSPDQVLLIPGAAEAIRRLNARGVATAVVTNQSGIARGLFAEEALGPIHATLESALHRSGARVEGIYYCPHHPTEGIPPYVVDCDCRKPKPGMLLAAARDLRIDLRRSFLVGDRISDIEAGHAAGTRAILVLTGNGRNAKDECRQKGIAPDAVVESLREAVEVIETWMG